MSILKEDLFMQSGVKITPIQCFMSSCELLRKSVPKIWPAAESAQVWFNGNVFYVTVV